MRDHHPYFMYDSIVAQPDAFITVITENNAKIKSVREKIQSSKRLFLVGTGTSFHTAQAGQYLFSAIKVNPFSVAITAFNFALYTPLLSKDDCVIVISHRGTKMFSIEALKLAKKAGAKTILITGKTEKLKEKYADDIFFIVEQEKSSAHTISYTSAQAILCALSNKNFTASTIATELRQCFKLEDKIKTVAKKIKDCRHIWVIGGGPSEITASEIALKIKETSYMQAEGMGTETLFHGPFQSADSNDFFILIAPNGKAQERTLELIPAIKEIGAKYIVIGNSKTKHSENWYNVAEVEEQYTTLSCLIPLQLLAYYLALVKSTNPDNFRLDNPKFASAEKFMNL